MKYIVYELGSHQAIILFSDLINHDDMAKSVGAIKVLGAGFVSEQLECFGQSTSLGIRSRGVLDTEVLDRHLGIKSSPEPQSL